MKKYIKFLALSVGVVAFLASCQCKTCKKESEISVQVCKGDGSQTDYDNYVSAAQNAGYTCN
jgi:hypothetical protein